MTEGMVYLKHYGTFEENNYYQYDNDHSWIDYTKEILVPNLDPKYPEGYITIRADDNFWIVAVLPYTVYKDMNIKDIVAKYWPKDLDKATLHDDFYVTKELIDLYASVEYVKTEYL